jgi:sRNA-binding carbon storage regulator CsrA
LGISAPPEITVRRAELARKASSESALNHGGGLAVEQVATADW